MILNRFWGKKRVTSWNNTEEKSNYFQLQKEIQYQCQCQYYINESFLYNMQVLETKIILPEKVNENDSFVASKYVKRQLLWSKFNF